MADVLGHTDTGLTGKEIGELLTEVKAHDLYPTITKRDRLREGLLECQALRWRTFGKQVIYDNRGCASLAWTYRHRKAIGPSTTLSDCNVSLWLLSATFETEFSSCGGVGS